MTAPQRIQLRRTKGWRKPAGAVLVSRPSRWGNPFHVVRAPGGGPWEVRYGLGPGDSDWVGERDTQLDAQEAAVGMFAAALRDGALLVTLADVRRDLTGKTLACWCRPGDPCHADVLLDEANAAEVVVSA
jgi:hypothetical protein